MSGETSGGADERLVVMLEARIAEFEKRMAQAEKTGTRNYKKLQAASRAASRQMEADALAGSRALANALGTVSTKVGGFAMAFAGGLAGGVITSALAGITTNVRGLIGDIGDLNDTAGRLGVDTDTLQGLQHGFKLQGVEISETTGALEKFVDGIGQAAQGSGTLKDTLEANGIALRGSNGELKDTAVLLRDYADLVNKAPDAAAKMALVTDAFGRGGKAIVGALEGGAPAIDAMIKAAKDGGYVLDASLVAKGAALDDKFDMLSGKIKVLFETGVVYSAAYFEGIAQQSADAFNGMIADANDALTAIQDMHLHEAIFGTGTPVDIKGTYELDALSEAARHASDALAGVLTGLSDNPDNEKAAQVILGLSDNIDQLTLDLQNNRISVSDYQNGLIDATGKSADFMESLKGINGVNLDDAVSVIRGLRDMMQGLADKANIAASAVAAVGNGPHAGGDNLTPPAPYDTGMDRGPDGTFGNIVFGPGGATVKPQPTSGGRSSGGGGGGGSATSDIDALLKDLETQREALTAWYTESQDLLAKATDAQLATLGGRHEAIERLEQEHQARLVALADDGQGTSLDHASTFFGALASITQAGGSRANKAYQAFAAAEALINTYRAQAQVLADPKLGFWAKFGAVAAIGAAGLALVSALKGAGGSKGGGSGGGSNSSTATGTASSDTAQSTLTVILQAIDPAKLYQGQGIIDLVNAIQKEVGVRGIKFGGTA